MKKKIFTLALSLFVGGLVSAQSITTYPYAADWKYKDGGLAADAAKGTANSDATQYDLGGWQTVKEKGTRPFFIAISSGAAVANTMEFIDGQQSSPQVAYMISPAFDFSADDTKVISFKCGREKLENAASNIDLLYTTNYTGDPATTAWESLGAALIPADQAGLNASSTMITVTTKTDVKGASIVLAIRAAKDEGFMGTAEAQTKLRIAAFTIAKEVPPVTGALPYYAQWNYRPEILKADSTLNEAMDANVGKYNANPAYFNLSGWEIKTVLASRTFYLPMTKEKKPISNTFEIGDNKKDNIYWLVSPQIDMSVVGDKYITFFAGREDADQLSSNLSVFYSLDYTDNVTTATWVPLRENILTKTQNGLNDTTMVKVVEKLSLNNKKVFFGIKSHKETQPFYALGAKQAKMRVKNFAVLLQEPTSGIKNSSATVDVNIYPVPTTDMLNIAVGEGIKQVIVANNLYQEVMRVANPANQISVAQLPFGVYYISIVLESGKVETRSFIKN